MSNIRKHIDSVIAGLTVVDKVALLTTGALILRGLFDVALVAWIIVGGLAAIILTLHFAVGIKD